MDSKYYRPYISDSESDTSSVTSQESYVNTLPNFKDFAIQLNSSNIGGPSFTDISSQIFYSRVDLDQAFTTLLFASFISVNLSVLLIT